MKRSTTSFKCDAWMITMAGLLILAGCAEHSQEDVLPTAKFTVDFQTISEGEAATVKVMLDKPVSTNSVIRISLETNAVYSQDFVVDQDASNHTISLVFPEGETTGEFTLTTFDDTKYDGDRFILFQFASSSRSIMLEQKSALTITIADDEHPSLVGFGATTASLYENANSGIIVELWLSQAAQGEGSVTVRLNAGEAVNGLNFMIDRKLENDSFSLNVARDQTRASFAVFPVDNELFTGNFILSFSIDEISGVVRKGANVKCAITLIDDEAPSIARFAATSGSVNEQNSNGIIVEIQLSAPVRGEGEIVTTVSGGQAVYGVDFTTTPEFNDGMMVLNLTNGQNGAAFKVFPVNNEVFKGNLTCLFSISETRGVIWTGSTSLNYQLQIIDDEVP